MRDFTQKEKKIKIKNQSKSKSVGFIPWMHALKKKEKKKDANRCWMFRIRKSWPAGGARGKSQGITRIHPLETMNGCTTFGAYTSNKHWDILVWTKVVDRPTDRDCNQSHSMAINGKYQT